MNGPKVGYSRLSHLDSPISGKPEIGGRPSFEARFARTLYWHESVVWDRSVRNGPARVATRVGPPVVGSFAPQPVGLFLSKIAVGSSSGPDG
jgi:hypothetical protein